VRSILWKPTRGSVHGHESRSANDVTYLLPAPSWRKFFVGADNVNQSPSSNYDMGISFSSLVCGEPEPEEVTVEHGDSVPNSKAIHAAIASGLAAASGSRNEELQAKRFDPRPSNPRSQLSVTFTPPASGRPGLENQRPAWALDSS